MMTAMRDSTCASRASAHESLGARGGHKNGRHKNNWVSGVVFNRMAESRWMGRYLQTQKSNTFINMHWPERVCWKCVSDFLAVWI